jgi:hypothetical protein
MQQRNKGSRCKTAAMRKQAIKGPRQHTAPTSEEGEDNHERHRRVELKTAITSGKHRNAQEDPI